MLDDIRAVFKRGVWLKPDAQKLAAIRPPTQTRITLPACRCRHGDNAVSNPDAPHLCSHGLNEADGAVTKRAWHRIVPDGLCGDGVADLASFGAHNDTVVIERTKL